ncbi:hypothetical protein PanWU01x14_263370 [Parasponia andersonii]|uniref:Uncharacterized protein n=1 Tax=Parasponia andersonii TaxID=3476 RepID=A0A2P5B7W8_PARAD|nr:hypothetical protein PanWU01x14_263370 [Parasponia andersonii]
MAFCKSPMSTCEHPITILCIRVPSFATAFRTLPHLHSPSTISHWITSPGSVGLCKNTKLPTATTATEGTQELSLINFSTSSFGISPISLHSIDSPLTFHIFTPLTLSEFPNSPTTIKFPSANPTAVEKTP